jgi:hypothetical protein
MAMEYRLWAKSPMWVGEIENPALPPVSLTEDVLDGLLAASPRPPFQGTVSKKFEDLLTKFFFDFDNKLLTPADAQATAGSLRDWARAATSGTDEDPVGRDVLDALRCADWLDTAAAGGWFVDWSR